MKDKVSLIRSKSSVITSFLFGCFHFLCLVAFLIPAEMEEWSACSGILIVYCSLLVVLFWIISAGFIYIDVRDYKQAKSAELRDIHSKLRLRPDAKFEDSVAEAAQGARYWKIGVLVRMWKDLYDNACFRVYR